MGPSGCRGLGPLRECLTSRVIVLALDTATAATSVAIRVPETVVSRSSIDAHGHVESLAPMIAEVLVESGLEPKDIDVIACGVGPGPFTGLRVGIAMAISMAVALDRPVVGVGTHDVIAHAMLGFPDPSAPVSAVTDGQGLIVATTARRAETFVSTYDASGQRVSGPIALTNEDARRLLLTGDLFVAGDAVDSLIGDALAHRRGPSHPDAAALAAIVESRLDSGEGWPHPADVNIDLDPATARGDTTAHLLAEHARRGRVLLPARPLYLRAPDAVATAAASTTMTGQDRSP